MENDVEKEIEEVLSADGLQQTLQVPISERQSPLTQSVKNGDIAKVKSDATNEEASAGGFRETAEREYAKEQARTAREDAPEQKIEQSKEYQREQETPEAIISDKQATQTAEALLGMADNFLAVGGGFFVKIRKHEEFFEFEELVEVIDSQNEKNIRRIRLDGDDKALLTPLLAQVIKNKTKQLSPEQQLLGAIISVIVKKAQTVMEVRSENKSLESRILQIVREAKNTPETTKEDKTDHSQEKENQQVPLEDMVVEDQVNLESEDDFEFDPVIYDVAPAEKKQTFETSNQAMGMDAVYEEVKAPQVVAKKQSIKKSSTIENKQKVMPITEEASADSDDTS